jgi:hypothetical protein
MLPPRQEPTPDWRGTDKNYFCFLRELLSDLRVWTDHLPRHHHGAYRPPARSAARPELWRYRPPHRRAARQSSATRVVWPTSCASCAITTASSPTSACVLRQRSAASKDSAALLGSHRPVRTDAVFNEADIAVAPFSFSLCLRLWTAAGRLVWLAGAVTKESCSVAKIRAARAAGIL